MTEEKKMPETAQDENLPAFIKAAPELLPLWDWWVKEGKSTLTMLCVAGIAVGGFFAVRNWIRASHDRQAAAFVRSCPRPEVMGGEAAVVADVEKAAADNASSKFGPLFKLRLAKAYYDAARFDEALACYEGLREATKSFPALAPFVPVGHACTLEACRKYKEAEAEFAAFAAANTNSFLLLKAQLGVARCKALQGNKADALKMLDGLKAAQKEEAEKKRVDQMLEFVNVYDPKRTIDTGSALGGEGSLYNLANAAEEGLKAEKAPAAPAKPAAK